MQDIEIREKIINLVSEILNIKQIDINSSQENTSEWDSLNYLSIISAIEEEFNIDITEKNINNFDSIKNIFNEVNRLWMFH